MKRNKQTKITFIIALLYVGIGTYDLYTRESLCNYLDRVYDGLDLYITFPSHVIGTLVWWLADGFIFKSFLWGIIGQILNLFVIWFIMLGVVNLIIAILNTSKR